MSVELVRGVLNLRDSRLSASERFVLLDYAEHANADTRRSWPSTATVSGETGLGQSTVERAMTKLRGLGYLVKAAKQRVGEHAWVWVYEVDLAVDDPSQRGVVNEGSLNSAVEEPPERGTNRKEEPEVKTQGVVELEPRRRPRDLMFDAIAEVCRQDTSGMTASAASVIGRVRRELLAAGASPDEIRARAQVYRRKFRDADLTPMALAKHWPSLAPPPDEPRNRDEWLKAYQ